MKHTKVVFVASKSQLSNPVYEARLWIATRNIGLSRRKLLDAIAKAIYDHQGLILIEGGHVWPVPDIYEVMGEDGRWLSYYCKAVDGRPCHKPRASTLERRRIIDLYFRIAHPAIARDFKSKPFHGKSEVITFGQ